MSDGKYDELPRDWGKIEGDHDPNFRPLTEEDMEGFSEEDWKIIESDPKNDGNDECREAEEVAG